jgi:hypothetical protein
MQNLFGSSSSPVAVAFAALSVEVELASDVELSAELVVLLFLFRLMNGARFGCQSKAKLHHEHILLTSSWAVLHHAASETQPWAWASA